MELNNPQKLYLLNLIEKDTTEDKSSILQAEHNILTNEEKRDLISKLQSLKPVKT